MERRSAPAVCIRSRPAPPLSRDEFFIGCTNRALTASGNARRQAVRSNCHANTKWWAEIRKLFAARNDIAHEGAGRTARVVTGKNVQAWLAAAGDAMVWLEEQEANRAALR